MVNRKKLGKKGEVLHYLPLIMMLALGIYLMFFISSNTKEAIEEKGVASLEFLELFREVQKRQLQIEYTGQKVAIATLNDYLSGKVSGDCGEMDGVRLLIGQEDYCRLTVDEFVETFGVNYSLAYNELYPTENIVTSFIGKDENKVTMNKSLFIKAPEQDYIFSYGGMSGDNILHGIASKKNEYMNEGVLASYSIEPSFDIRLDLELEDNFSKLFSDSISLVSACANSLVLQDCLDQEVIGNSDYSEWEYGVCEFQGYNEKNRVATFCVESEMQVFNSGIVETLKYSFALDFTPFESFVVENLQVSYDPLDPLLGYDLWFDAQDTASSYKIYITDYVIPDFIGSADEFELQRINSDTFEFVEISVDSLDANCPEPPVVEVGYSCADQVRYVYPLDALISGETYYFAVTSLIGDKESQISGFETN